MCLCYINQINGTLHPELDVIERVKFAGWVLTNLREYFQYRIYDKYAEL
jgi:hypothetical protein